MAVLIDAAQSAALHIRECTNPRITYEDVTERECDGCGAPCVRFIRECSHAHVIQYVCARCGLGRRYGGSNR